MEHEQRKSNFGSQLLFWSGLILVASTGAMGVELEQIADEVLAELGRLIEGVGSDPPPPSQA